MSENNEIKEPLNKNYKVPKLRFKGFEEDWIVVNFYNHFTYFSTNSLSWDELNYNYGDYLNLHYGIIHSNNSNLILSSSLPFINQDKLPKRFTLINEGDLILTDTSEDRKDAAKGIEIINQSNAHILSGLHTIHLREKAPCTIPGFKTYYVASKSFRNFARKYCEGIKVFSIKPSLLKYTHFAYPQNKNEQFMIVDFFNKIEDKKAILEKKIDILKKYKEGLIKKLIKSSSKVMKLSQLITVCEKTKLQSSYGKISGKYKFFVNSSDEITKWSDDYIFDGEYLILNTGGTAFTNYVNDKFSAMSDCLVVKPNSEYSITIYYWLKVVEKWINEVGFQGTGLKHLDINWLLRQKVKIIEYDNKKLSNFNKELNSLIELNSLVLEKLKLIKNIFLNLMFI